MPTFTATAPGKIILFGEHAVVYGQPALAVPVAKVRARAIVVGDVGRELGGLHVAAPDINLDALLTTLPPGNPIRKAVMTVLEALSVPELLPSTLTVTSSIPIASGLGSGAAVSVAIIRALSAFLGHRLGNERVSALAYQVEKIHHGTPSGIDNTVVAYEKPVYFVRPSSPALLPQGEGSESPSPRGTPRRAKQGGRGEGPTTFTIPSPIPSPFTLLIGDTGIPSPTKQTVGDVRRAWQANPEGYQRLFTAVGDTAKSARQAIESGHPQDLGPLMDKNHKLLQKMDISSPELDHLVDAAREAGALGAKLSGGGRGGNMIALVEEERAEIAAQAIRKAGAVGVIRTRVREGNADGVQKF